MSVLQAESLADIFTRNRADKVVNHSYAPVYEELLGPLRDKPITLLEIGVLNGGSLLSWLDWMPNATVIGLDVIVPKIEHPRLTLHACHQTDGARLVEPNTGLFPLNREPSLDVIIDDGSHRIEHQLTTMHFLWHALRPGGLYIVEDIQDYDFWMFFAMMPYCRVWDLRHEKGRYDDILICMEKE